MKSLRNIAFSALLTVGAFSTVFYTSCTKDECKDVVCNNGGTCITGTCSCPTGYEGSDCSIITRDKFKGDWKGSDVCTKNTYNVTLTIKESTEEVRALIQNPGGFGTNITITGRVSGTNKLTFTDQSVGGNGRILNGTMTFDGSTMDFTYTVVDAANDTDSCNGTYSKQ